MNTIPACTSVDPVVLLNGFTIEPKYLSLFFLCMACSEKLIHTFYSLKIDIVKFMKVIIPVIITETKTLTDHDLRSFIVRFLCE